MIKIRKGLDLPIAGEPEQEIEDARPVRSVALLGQDYPGMKPTMVVNEGDSVVKGQLLFTDKKTAGVEFVAPASGRVSSINRGAKRVFISLVIDVEDEEQGSERGFNAYSKEDIVGLDADTIKQQLVQSGSWTALRTRPYSKIPSPDSSPRAIFVTAIDTNPLGREPDFEGNTRKKYRYIKRNEVSESMYQAIPYAERVKTDEAVDKDTSPSVYGSLTQGLHGLVGVQANEITANKHRNKGAQPDRNHDAL